MDKEHLFAVLIVGVVALFAVGAMLKPVSFESASGYAFNLPSKLPKFNVSKLNASALKPVAKAAEQKQEPRKLPAKVPLPSQKKKTPAIPLPENMREAAQRAASRAPEREAPIGSELCDLDLFPGTNLTDCEAGINNWDLPGILDDGTYRNTRYTQDIFFVKNRAKTGTFGLYQDDDDAPVAGLSILIDDSVGTPLYKYMLRFDQPIPFTDGHELQNTDITIQRKNYRITNAVVQNGRLQSLTLRSGNTDIELIDKRRPRVNGVELNGHVSNLTNNQGAWNGFEYTAAPDLPNVNELYLREGDAYVDQVFGGFKIVFKEMIGDTVGSEGRNIDMIQGGGGAQIGGIGLSNTMPNSNEYIPSEPITLIRNGTRVTLPKGAPLTYQTFYNGKIIIDYDSIKDKIDSIRFIEAPDQNLIDSQRLQGNDVVILPYVESDTIKFRLSINSQKGFGPMDQSRGDTLRVFFSYKGTEIVYSQDQRSWMILHPRSRIYARVFVASPDWNG